MQQLRADSNLVNHNLVRKWLWWSLVWLTIFPLVGLLVSIKFHYPQFLGETSWLTFGRLRPLHVNGVIFGAFSTPFFGMLYYLVPRLCGRRMAWEHWGGWLLVAWNIFLVLGSVSFLLGYNLGFEADEYQWPLNILRWIILLMLGTQVLATVFKRVEPGFYVSLWYVVAALVWTLMNLILGNVILPYVEMSGISNAALHGLYIHYVVGLWITPAGLAVLYYFTPLSTKNPLFSHRLSLLGFWSLAFLYPFVGTHHYLFSPIPYENQTISIVTSMMLIIPVWAVITNMFGTALGRWGAIIGGKDGDSYSAKFLMLATLYYLLGCFQGSTEALRRVQELTHFTDFVISHSHFTVFGTFVLAVVGGMYYLWPRVTGRQLWSWRLASWHIWLTISGTTLMLIGLTAQGFIQGSMLEFGANFVDSVVEMKPWWISRTLAGATMDIGLLLMLINFTQTVRKGKPYTPPEADTHFTETKPAGEEVGWYSRPSTIFIIAGMGFFFLAVLVQGIMPSILPQTYNPTVSADRTGQTIRVSDYTSLEEAGRKVYIREGCWYCHSQYVRNVTGEEQRWGPVSQAGEYVYDQPHMLSTRRIGPDLSRVGRKYGDDWHAAHYWNPREVVPDSVMPRFPWLFNSTGDNDGDTPELSDEGKALVAYVQSLGTNIGDWRETFASTRLTGGAALQLSRRDRDTKLLPLGRQVYERRCIGCHGINGDGQGPSARFLHPKPRDFTSGIFKFRSTQGADSLPTDEDLFITISHGLWGTAMPPWYNLGTQERLAVIAYIKTFSERWENDDPTDPIAIPKEPPITLTSLKQGKQAFDTNCTSCHGESGQGNGPAAEFLEDTWGHKIKPANYTLPAGEPGGVKLGHDSQHIYKTMMTGIGGTPMPAFADVVEPETAWNIVHYVQSLRIDAQIAELTQAGLTKPVQTAGFCTSTIPWLRAACEDYVMPVITLCSGRLLRTSPKPNTEANPLALARQKLWASLSPAANRGRIDNAVLSIDSLASPQVAALNSRQSKGQNTP